MKTNERFQLNIRSITEVVTVSPLLAYAATYFYETSYNEVYGIPRYLFKFDIAHVALTLTIITFVPALLFLLLTFILSDKSLAEQENQDALGEAVIVILVLLLGTLLCVRIAPSLTSIAAPLFLLMSAVTLYLRIRHGIRFLPKRIFSTSNHTPARLWLFDKLENYLGTSNMATLGLLVLTFFALPFLLGGVLASVNTTFYKIQSRGNCIVLTVANNVAVCGYTDVNNPRRLTGKYSLVDLTGENIFLERQKLGPLTSTE